MKFSTMPRGDTMLAAIVGISAAPAVSAQDIGALEKRVKAKRRVVVDILIIPRRADKNP